MLSQQFVGRREEAKAAIAKGKEWLLAIEEECDVCDWGEKVAIAFVKMSYA